MNSTTVSEKAGASVIALTRIVREGYGTGAWHGPGLKAALAEDTKEAAFRRPDFQRHDIRRVPGTRAGHHVPRLASRLLPPDLGQDPFRVQPQP